MTKNLTKKMTKKLTKKLTKKMTKNMTKNVTKNMNYKIKMIKFFFRINKKNSIMRPLTVTKIVIQIIKLIIQINSVRKGITTLIIMDLRNTLR